MEETVDVRHLLGTPVGRELILLAGPDPHQMEQIARQGRFPIYDGPRTDDPRELRAARVGSRRSLVVIRCIPEVEGILDRSAFFPHVELAYAADRVVYVGPRGAVRVWPQTENAFLRITAGRLQVRQCSGATVRRT